VALSVASGLSCISVKQYRLVAFVNNVGRLSVLAISLVSMGQASAFEQSPPAVARHRHAGNPLLVCMRQKMHADRSLFYNDAMQACKSQLTAQNDRLSRTLTASGASPHSAVARR